VRLNTDTIALWAAVAGLIAFWTIIGFPMIVLLQIGLIGPTPKPITDSSLIYIAAVLATVGCIGSLYLLKRWSR
jgi:hypothetical protein